MRHAIVSAALLLLLSITGFTQTQTKPPPKQLPPRLVELLKKSPEEFIKRFDKNKDGMLSKNEVPLPFMQKNFGKWDLNGDDKLDREEVSQMLNTVRGYLGLDVGAAKANPQVEKVVSNILMRMDTDKDGKISKDEAKNQIAANFAVLDKNKDGYLDRAELRVVAARFLAKGKGGKTGKAAPAQAGFDFDALDANADGRLTRNELKGSPLLQRFAEIDTNRDGQIDRREFAAFVDKQAAK